MKRWWIGGSVLGLAGCLVGAWAWKASAERPDVQHRLTLNGNEVTVEQFHPPETHPSEEPAPAILMLHGIDGADHYGRYYRSYARTLANAGFEVFYVHYFDGFAYDKLFGMTEDELGERILTDRGDWIDVTADLVRELSGWESIDGDRIGLLGFSLGGFVSLSATERLQADDGGPQVAVVVEFFAGLFEDGKGNPIVNVEGFPPVLILHGEQDQRVPVDKAYELREKLTNARVPFDIKTYPDRGHGILGEDAADRACRFFQDHLTKSASVSRT